MSTLSAKCIAVILCAAALCSCTGKVIVTGTENSECVVYNGVTYVGSVFYNADSDRKKLGKAETGATVYAVGNSSPPSFLLLEGYDNSGCYIASRASVPTSGKVTKALVDPGVRRDNSKYLSEEAELEVLEELSQIDGELRQFTVDNYYTDGNSFYYVYNNSGVSCEENWGGYVAYTEGKWIFVSPEKGSFDEWGDKNSVKVTAVTIEDNDLIKRMCKTDLTKYIEY